VRFLVDAQLPPALARLLTQHGHVAEHVHDVGLGAAPDEDVSRYAVAHQAALVTKDQDFADLSLLVGSAPAVVWVRLGNTSRRALLARFAPSIDQIVAMIEAGDTLVELR
jgi:predicted nuclease of predicted toxin-antitoxin system